MQKVAGMAGRIGVLLDELRTAKLKEISYAVEMDLFEVVQHAIDTMYEAIKDGKF